MQSISNDINNTDIFVRNSIEDTFQNYLQEFQIPSLNSLKDNDPTSNKEKILLAVTRDFNSFKIDFDLFISILGMIWIVNPDMFDPLNQTIIEKMCFKILDLQWSIRNEPERNMKALTEVLEYYKLNKKKLNP